MHLVSNGSGSASNHVQLWGPVLRIEKDACLVLTFRARSSTPVRFPGVGILLGGPPYTRFASSRPLSATLTADWETYQSVIEISQSAEEGRLHISLGGVLPDGAVFEFQPQSLHLASPSIADPLTVDVGNIIFDGGDVCGWKKWSIEDLNKPYDYYYDGATQRVYLYSEAAPAARHHSIELALARHVVNQGGKHHVIYDGLAVMNGAAHGFGGGSTHNLVIRNCDLGYIGGAHQHTRPDGTPVRFGNAIEFWGAAAITSSKVAAFGRSTTRRSPTREMALTRSRSILPIAITSSVTPSIRSSIGIDRKPPSPRISASLTTPASMRAADGRTLSVPTRTAAI